MKRPLHFFVILALPLLFVVPSFSQDPLKKNGAAETQKADRYLVHFLDGSSLFMQTTEQAVEITTAFGKLKIPPQNIRSIEFGLHLTTAEVEKIEELIEDLTSPVFKEQEAALLQLLELGGKAYPSLKKAALSEDEELAQRAEVVMEHLEKEIPPKLLRRPAEDIIHTDKFMVVGKIDVTTLQGRTELFGDVKLKPGQALSMHWLGQPREMSLAINAALHGSADTEWLRTRFHINAHDTINITAFGQVDLWPQGPGLYLAGPAGRAGAHHPGYGTLGPEASTAGALIGKVGETGEPFFIGSRLSETFAVSGELYLHIVPSPWRAISQGGYQVTISRGNAEK